MRVLLVCWERVAGWIERLTPLFVLIGVVVLAALVVEVLGQQQTLGHQQRALAHQQREIQESRRIATLAICLEGNDRHNKAKAGLKILVAAQPKPKHSTAARRHQQQHFFNVFLAAIAPRYDCAARTRRLTKP